MEARVVVECRAWRSDCKARGAHGYALLVSVLPGRAIHRPGRALHGAGPFRPVPPLSPGPGPQTPPRRATLGPLTMVNGTSLSVSQLAYSRSMRCGLMDASTSRSTMARLGRVLKYSLVKVSNCCRPWKPTCGAQRRVP